MRLSSNTKSILIFVLILVVVFVGCYLVNHHTDRFTQGDNHPILNRIRENFAKIHPQYSTIPMYTGDSAYTENKSTITMCVVNPKTGKFYDMNTLMYISIHELAHMVSKTHGHNEEFKTNFAHLLKKAIGLGIYNPNIPLPSNYCGMKDNE